MKSKVFLIMTVCVCMLVFAQMARPMGGGGGAYGGGVARPAVGVQRPMGGGVNGGGYRTNPGGAFIHTERPEDNSLRRPWAGSISYERKKEESAAKSVYHRARQDARVAQENVNYEVERARARAKADAREAERVQDLRDAKDEVRQKRYEAEVDKREILDENRATIRKRASEQEKGRGW